MWLSVNMQRVVEFLVGLLDTPSPTGYHEEAMRYVRERFGSLGLDGLEFRETNKGARQGRDPPRCQRSRGHPRCHGT